jgi:predicted RNA methylase
LLRSLISTAGNPPVLNIEKCQEFSMTEIRQLVAALGVGFEQVRARSKVELCERLRQRLADRKPPWSLEAISTDNERTKVSSHASIANAPVPMADTGMIASPPLAPISPLPSPIELPSSKPAVAESMPFAIPHVNRATSEPIQVTVSDRIETAPQPKTAVANDEDDDAAFQYNDEVPSPSPSPEKAPSPVKQIIFSGGSTSVEGQYPLSHMSANEIEIAFRVLYGRSWGQTGDVKLPEEDEVARRNRASLLFGEVLPEGVCKLLDGQHLDAGSAQRMVDLGCGFGKLVLQAFLTYPNLMSVTGIELCVSRFQEAKRRMAALAFSNPDLFTWRSSADGLSGELIEGRRTLKIVCGDMFGCTEARHADIVICETNVPIERHADLAQLIGASKSNSRILMYHTLRTIPGVCIELPSATLSSDQKHRDPIITMISIGHDRTNKFEQVAPFDSSVTTTWAREKGHHFDLWRHLPHIAR